MKQILLTAMAAAVAAGAIAVPRMKQKPVSVRAKAKIEANASTISQIRKKKPLRAAENAVWRPGHEEAFYLDEGEWYPMGEVDLTYYSDGKLKGETYAEDGEYDEYSYTEHGMRETLTVYSIDEDGQKEPQSLTKYFYDEKDPTYLVLREKYSWDGEDWALAIDGTTKYEVTRDADGNVTQMLLQTCYDGEWYPAYRYNVSYTDGKASAFLWDVYSWEGDWVTQVELRDITWDRTNGQLLISSEDDIPYEFVEGNNRMASYTVYSDGEPFAKYTATYGTNNSWTLNGEAIAEELGGAVNVISRTYTDEYGSYVETNEESEDDEIYFAEKAVINYDKFGNLLLDEETCLDLDWSPDYEMIYGEKCDITYSEEFGGQPTELISSYYDLETASYLPEMKLVESDFVNVLAGISAVEADNSLSISGGIATANTGISVYSVSGAIVLSGNGKADLNSLPSGVYIVRAGSQAVKICR